MAFVPRSVMPYIRSTLSWVGSSVCYVRKTSKHSGKCVGHVLDVRLRKNGSIELLVNCYDHADHRPMWKAAVEPVESQSTV